VELGASKLSFDVDILIFLATFPKIKRYFIQLSGHTGPHSVILQMNNCPLRLVYTSDVGLAF